MRDGWQGTCKSVIDRLGSLLLLAGLSPLLLACALLVRVTSPGSILYRRRVVGLHGEEFDALKFRTMVVGAEERLRRDEALQERFDVNWKLRDDPRLTPVGGVLRRTSLDELPQLINVLQGSMSLVGPRMIAPDEAAKYGPHLAKRLHVKPGITGLWQVSGRNELNYDQRVKLDLEYIDNWSLRLDLSILARTIPAVLSMRGAY